MRDAGGPPSDVHQKLIEEVHNIAKATLFAPVLHAETIQAMSKSSVDPMVDVITERWATSLVLVSGWSDNGWLSGGHAVRMAMELCMSVPYSLVSTCSPLL